MGCTNYWGSPYQVGSHHLARKFVAEGWKVFFISEPISPFHVMTWQKTDFRERMELYMSGGKYFFDRNLWAYVPASLLSPNNKPILKTKTVQQNWYKLMFPSVNSIVKQMGGREFDLIYLDSSKQAFWLKTLDYKKSVFRIADNQSGFKQFTTEMKLHEREIASSVDLVVYTARTLERYVEEFQPRNTLYLPNGVDFSHFQNSFHRQPPEFKDISKPIVIYVGAMQEWFDFRLINWSAKMLPEVAFVLIGPSHYAKSRLRNLPNIHILGRRDYEDIPSYLSNADVGVIPFNVIEYPVLVNSVSPLKLFEYLACGLPVVSTAWEELKNLKAPITLADTNEQFIMGIKNALLEENDPSLYVSYARQQDWSNRVRMLLEHIQL